MDREQHLKQDASEHYAVFHMASAAFESGVGPGEAPDLLWRNFESYLAGIQWRMEDFESTYPEYHRNVESQIPRFVDRLIGAFPGSSFSFAIDEARYRNAGIKADFSVQISSEDNPRLVSLKNYIGSGGILRPQVSSGTLFSFAAGFVFERAGVGTFVDPRPAGGIFAARNGDVRNAVLSYLDLDALRDPLQELQDLSGYVKQELLKPEYHFYDQDAVKVVVEHVARFGRAAILAVFDILGPNVVRAKFLERAGLFGDEDVLYFDSNSFVDSITQPTFHDLRVLLNHPDTDFRVEPRGAGLSFTFYRAGSTLLQVSVPLTVNTNGAWHRPRERYDGAQAVNDVGILTMLKWGELRPRKSRQIDTSTNTYLDLRSAGIFEV